VLRVGVPQTYDDVLETLMDGAAAAINEATE
jgi:hypothetical protein